MHGKKMKSLRFANLEASCLAKMGLVEVMLNRATLRHSPQLWSSRAPYRRGKLFDDQCTFISYTNHYGRHQQQACRPSASSSPGFKPQPSRKKSQKNNYNAKSDGKPEIKKPVDTTGGAKTQPSTESSLDDNILAPTLSLASNVPQKQDEALSFEERLEAIKRAAQEKKQGQEKKMYGPIDYDAPVANSATDTVSVPVKVGIGIGVVVFGLVFVLGDFLPSPEFNSQKTNINNMKQTNVEQAARLKEQLQGFEAILKIHPDDLAAIEGAAVTYAELGDFAKSETELERLLEKTPTDVEALRLLAEVQATLGKFDKSAATYRQAIKVSPRSITLLKGLVEDLVSSGKQKEAVEELITEREKIRKQSTSDSKDGGNDIDQATLVQVGLLLGKTYSQWGHISDAFSVYDSIIKSNPEEFQGYLAKGILLKEQGQKGEADRMFIQARYFAPENFKLLVDRYSK